MLDRLALLAHRRGRRVVIVAVVLSIAAGALGAGVADRLDPYGADDPATERPGPYAALRYGLGMAEFAIGWCDEILNELKEKN